MREFRIVTNGKKYRVQARKRRLTNRCLGIGWHFLLHLPKHPSTPRHLVPFEFDSFEKAETLMNEKIQAENRTEDARKERWVEMKRGH